LVKIKLYKPLDGRRNFKGTLLGLEGETVRVEADGQVFEIPLQSIAKANLEIDF
jgi:ribosome maturation factor RimP